MTKEIKAKLKDIGERLWKNRDLLVGETGWAQKGNICYTWYTTKESQHMRGGLVSVWFDPNGTGPLITLFTESEYFLAERA